MPKTKRGLSEAERVAREHEECQRVASDDEAADLTCISRTVASRPTSTAIGIGDRGPEPLRS
jgi:hypothetical protein